MSKEAIDELKRIRSILSGITGLEDDDQEYIEDARKSVDRIIEALAERPAQQREPVAHCRIIPLRGESWPTVEVHWVSEPVPGPLYTSPQPARPSKPVAWMYQCSADSSGPVLMQNKRDWAESGSGLWTETPLYKSPPEQRTWVGLTEDEVTLCHSLAVLSKKHDGTDPSFTILLHRQIEAKLREKNAQPSKPLTDEQIREFYGDNNNFEITGPYVIAFARAIEAAHGITGEQK